MVDVAAFKALRYDSAVAGHPATTSAPAYDELEPLLYAHHRTASPYTVLQLLATAGDYRAAGEAYRRWLRTGVLVEEPRAALYRYEEHELRGAVPAVQRGILAAVRLETLAGGATILAHEQVDPARVEDRLDRLAAVPADLTPVYAFAEGLPDAVREVMDRPPATPPLLAFSDAQGVDHRVWPLADRDEIIQICEALRPVSAVIADGHHRYAAALAFRERRRACLGTRPGRDAPGLSRDDAPWERVLTYLVDGRVWGPRVAAVHRLIRRLPDGFEAALARRFAIEPAAGQPGALQRAVAERDILTFGLWLAGGRGRLLVARDEAGLRSSLPAERSSLWRSLDTPVLDTIVLPELGVEVSSVQHRADLDGAVAEVEGGAAAALVIVGPVSVDTVAALARRGEALPPKSTHFLPKPRAGLVMRRLVDSL